MAAVLPIVIDGDRKRQYNPASDTVAGLTNTVLSVNGLTGAVALTTTEVAEGSNLYHTTARARAAAVADAIVDGVTDVAPSQNAVFDGLALKANLAGGNAFTGAQEITVNASGSPAVTGINTAVDAFITTAHLLTPNMTSGQRTVVKFGKENSLGNAGDWNFFWQGNGDVANRVDFGFAFDGVPAFSYNFAKQVGIGTTTPDVSSLFEVASTTKGLLTPRMTTAQKNAIVTPANGLVVYDLTLGLFCWYNSTTWVTLTPYTDEAVDDRVATLIQDAGGIRKSYNDAGNTLTLNTAFATQLLNVVDQKTAGTDGGSFTSGAWRTRDLNTVRTNEITGASVAANQITLPAGTYYCEWTAPCASDNNDSYHKTRLQNITGAATLLVGDVGFFDGTVGLSTVVGQNNSNGSGRFTLGATSVIELQHQKSSTENTFGFGLAGGFATVEIYSQIKIWKVA